TNNTKIKRHVPDTKNAKKNPAFHVYAKRNGITANVNNLPCGKLNMKIVNLAGKICYSSKFVLTGEKPQLLKTNFVPGTGVYIMILEHKSVKHSVRFCVR
ncbi:MAG: hypothetical protein Q4F84_07635, partial [Fibrobacter sp.]|nr:hypothetical protein [Fibrobacter sp.]